MEEAGWGARDPGAGRGWFSYSFGLGINSSIGRRDGTFDLKALGCGMKVGRTIGVSFLDNELSVDLGQVGLWRRPPGATSDEEAH